LTARAFVAGVSLVLSGCAAQTFPLEAGAEASRQFLVGDWFGTYEWPTDAFKVPRKILVSIRSVQPDGAVQATVQLFGPSGEPLSAPQAIAGTLTEGRLHLKYLDRFTLSRVADDRLAGEAWISTRGGLQGTRMERIDLNLRREGK